MLRPSLGRQCLRSLVPRASTAHHQHQSLSARATTVTTTTTTTTTNTTTTTRLSSSKSSHDKTSDRIPTNDPQPANPPPNVSSSNAVPISPQGVHDQDKPLQELPEEGERRRVMQAPNRATVWSRSQQPRERAMSGPRFEQTIVGLQPQPEAAISLIHQQPVRWTSERKVSCDGGGGPLGHPRIFINVDKPQINFCTYCGLPFANEHHRKHLESLPSTTYPLEPVGAPAEVPESQRVTDEPMSQR